MLSCRIKKQICMIFTAFLTLDAISNFTSPKKFGFDIHDFIAFSVSCTWFHRKLVQLPDFLRVPSSYYRFCGI